ncbi:hypothetical protein BT67DRAFT_451810 [Trichocladium antarcticum]|uniref:Uncharacterized protein n=1 Tax=Trichocladium antarcticum TaxID=1450529 RepID=A0AAN6UEL9_9PEZI|nr:hypothetical protein BT67DRAFT_451810 [Trichocladium antarcticum]
MANDLPADLALPTNLALPPDLTPLIAPASYAECPHVESLQWYGPAKMHPAHLGDRLQGGRFLIVAKLDHENHSLSWLCRDTVHHRWRRVAIIFGSDAITQLWHGGAQRRLRERRRLADDDHHQARADLWGEPLEIFWERGPSATHCCVVLPLNGPWGLFRQEIWDKTTVSERWLVRQCGRLRGPGGGAAPESVHDITTEEMVRILGRPQIIPVTDELWERWVYMPNVRREHVPRYLVLRPARIEEDWEFWLSPDAFETYKA